VLIVNVASACGLTPQYEKLQKLYEATKNKLVIVGVPCNDFAAQEPGSPTEIRNFCTVNYGVTFPITEKVNIKTEPIHPLYQLLTMKEKNLLVDSEVEWNFQKYLLNEQGILTNVFKPDVQPDDEAITQAVLR
jgi:glutathione peroxidase